MSGDNFFLLSFGAVARQQFLPAVFVDALAPSACARAPTERKNHRLATEKKVKRCDFSRGAFIFSFFTFNYGGLFHLLLAILDVDATRQFAIHHFAALEVIDGTIFRFPVWRIYGGAIVTNDIIISNCHDAAETTPGR